MKIQVRRSVFETNSSTQHTLTLRKLKTPEDFWKEFLGTHHDITFGITPISRIYDILEEDDDIVNVAKMNIQERLDCLFYCALGFFRIGTVIGNMAKTVNMFRNKGFSVDINFDQFIRDCDIYIDVIDSGFMQTLAKVTDENESNVAWFLSTDDAFYTCYADDYEDYPDEIRKIDAYYGKFKSSELLFYRDRC